MTTKADEEKKGTSENWIVVVLIVIVLYILLLFKKQKKKELEEIKIKLQENQKLLKALERKTRITFLIIRCLFILSYFIVNYYYHHYRLFSKDELLTYNTILFIIVSALTFAKFGSFNSYNSWWNFAEVRIEVGIYRRSPDLKKIIEADKKYKSELEKEIKDLDSIL